MTVHLQDMFVLFVEVKVQAVVVDYIAFGVDVELFQLLVFYDLEQGIFVVDILDL